MASSKPAIVPTEPLVVVVAGGGPVGLTFSLHLAMLMGKHVNISIYEGRWFVDEQGQTRWQDERHGKNRRDQVVTLQDHVIEQMPDYVQRGLFHRIDERVWPTSRNIPIREVEDRLFELIQPFVQCGQIQLIPENLNEQSPCLIDGDFDVLVGTDGANSFVRRYCNIQMISEGSEYACGVAYNIPDKVSGQEEPLHQALNCILTVSQTRYLVNSSTSRRGFLNIRLIKSEYEELQSALQALAARKEPIDLLDYDKCPQSPEWSIIRQGLEFFKIQPKYVHRVLPIEINVRHASIVVRELRFQMAANDAEKGPGSQRNQFKTTLAFLAGDAAMNVHFWPGRGMNSGMKAAMALARNILRACTKDQTIQVRKPLRFLDFLDYEAFMARLRAREQQGRSLRVLVNPIDAHITASYLYAHLSHCYVRYTTKLVRKLQEARDRLATRADWPHQDRPISDDELRSASHRISHNAVAQLSLANPWPTREMSGADVLVEEWFPFDRQRFFPVPTTSPPSLTTIRSPAQQIAHRVIILWITGTDESGQMHTMADEIRRALNVQPEERSDRIPTHLKTLESMNEVQEWVRNLKASDEKSLPLVKVITPWNVNRTQTAIDVIVAVRSVVPRAPVLVFTNQLTDARPALEFPNVMASDVEFEVKEFLDIRQETQWTDGLRVTTDRRQRTPRIVWFDRCDCDPVGIVHIKDTYPTIEIDFVPTYEGAENFFQQSAQSLRNYEKVLFICHGYYREQSKNYADIADLLQRFQFDVNTLVVYTRNRDALLQTTNNSRADLCIVENRKQLYAFLARHLRDYVVAPTSF